MSNERFILEKYKGRVTRYTCPACDRKNEFARYIDTDNKYSFPDNVGRCNRESSCGYHYTPSEFFKDNPDERKKLFDEVPAYMVNVTHVPTRPTQPPKLTDYFDEKIMLASIQQYDRNSFTNALGFIFDADQIGNIINRYKLGTTKSGAVVFWQVDINGRIRYGKAMTYLPDLHRDKTKHPVGVHSLMGKYDFNHKQCYFGEHLLREYPDKVVAVVESEKSACICSEVLPDYVWLSTGGKNGCKWIDKDVCSVLKGRKVILFPDVDAHTDWIEKSKILQGYGINMSVFDGLYEIAKGTQQDIADHFIIDIKKRKEQVCESVIPKPIMAENPAVNTPAPNPVVASMTAKNPALSKLIEIFDCEITHTDTYEPQPDRPLSRGELITLAAGLPSNNSFTKNEISKMLDISLIQVNDLIEASAVYHIPQNQKYCKQGGIPF